MKKRNKRMTDKLITFGIVIVAFIFCQIMISTGNMSRSLRGQLIPICVYIIMAVSLNLTVGISGELSLGHAGFMSVGAFSGIIAAMWMHKGIGVENQVLCLIFAIVAGGIFAGIAGVLIGIPVLRLRGDYLAIVTLAFGEIIRNVMNCIYISLDGQSLHFGFVNPNLPGKLLLNGPAGTTGIVKMSTFPMAFALVLLTLLVVLNLIDSRNGRAIMAIRDSRIAAESVGLQVTRYKMMAFVTSAVLAGMAGAIYGLNFSTVTAAKFKFDTSILVLVFVVMGGIGNIRGSVIAATLLTVLPELLRAFSDFRMLFYAILLILVMLVGNNPTLRSMVLRIIPRRKNQSQDGEVN